MAHELIIPARLLITSVSNLNKAAGLQPLEWNAPAVATGPSLVNPTDILLPPGNWYLFGQFLGNVIGAWQTRFTDTAGVDVGSFPQPVLYAFGAIAPDNHNSYQIQRISTPVPIAIQWRVQSAAAGTLRSATYLYIEEL